MLVPALVGIIIVLGVVITYISVIAPRINPANKAEKFIEQKQYDEAIMEYKKILENQPKNFTVHYKLALLFLDEGRVDPAAIHLEEILNINKYNHEVEKVDVLRSLAKIYNIRDDKENTFQTYFDLLKYYPTDEEALFHVAFMTLGQELFDQADRYFERLVKSGQKSFEILFGAGMASYQNQKTNESIQNFKEALSYDSHSDITNIAMAFALRRKRDFKTAVNYAKLVMDTSSDPTAIFISKRLYAILNVQAKKPEEALKRLEELLEYAKNYDMPDEHAVLLYDIGFTCLCAEKTSQAYEYWNQLYQLDRGYKNVQQLITLLRKEMDSDSKQMGTGISDSIINYIEPWLTEAFPVDFIWRICGLKSRVHLDLSRIITTTRSTSTKGVSGAVETGSDEPVESLEKLLSLDTENFRIISNRVVSKLGYQVLEILETYRESDGVDFMAQLVGAKDKTLVWVRRWQGVEIGEIPIRNFAQAINDSKCKDGVFITATALAPSAEESLKRLSKVTVVYPDQLTSLLKGLV